MRAFLLCSLLCLPQDPPAAGSRVFSSGSFFNFADQLEKPDVAVVIGRLPKLTEGKRERMKEDEGTLSEGNTKTNMSGTVFYRVAVTGRLTVIKALWGAEKETSFQLAFDIQQAKLGSGTVLRHYLLSPRVRVEDNQLAMFVLGKVKATWQVLQVMRFDRQVETGDDAEAVFLKRAEDTFAVNRRMFELKRALDDAQAAKERGDRKGGAAALRKALGNKVKLLLPESEAALTANAGPIERRVREKIQELDPDGDR